MGGVHGTGRVAARDRVVMMWRVEAGAACVVRSLVVRLREGDRKEWGECSAVEEGGEEVGPYAPACLGELVGCATSGILEDFALSFTLLRLPCCLYAATICALLVVGFKGRGCGQGGKGGSQAICTRQAIVDDGKHLTGGSLRIGTEKLSVGEQGRKQVEES